MRVLGVWVVGIWACQVSLRGVEGSLVWVVLDRIDGVNAEACGVALVDKLGGSLAVGHADS